MATTRKRASVKPSKPAVKRAAPVGAGAARRNGADSTVIVTTDGERVSREDFHAVPVDETVIVTVDGKRVKRIEYKGE